MIKVGLYTPYLRANNPGAPNVCLINIARQLVKRTDVDLHLVCGEIGEHPLYHEAPITRLSRAPLMNVFKLRREKFDLIHFNRLPIAPALLPIVALLNIPKVSSIHGGVHMNADAAEESYSLYTRTMQPIVSKLFDLLIPVSHNLGDELIRRWHVPENKIRPIHEGIAHDVFKPLTDAKAESMRRYGLESDFILHVSNYSPRKNPKGLFGAFEKVVNEGFDLDLVITGAGWNEKANEFLNDLDFKTRKRIKILGSVPLKDLPVLYSAAELFFSPTFHENFGFPNIEAMACGTPVVTSNVYAVPEITGRAALLCNPENVSDLANAIGRIVRDKNLRNNMVIWGLENANRFTWEKCAEETVQAYKKVVCK